METHETSSNGVEAEVAEILPGGVEPPHEVPEEIFFAALKTYLDSRRVDMRALAQQLGMARSTLYKRSGSRDQLLGAVLWYVTRRALADSLVAAELDLQGIDWLLGAIGHYLRQVERQAPFRRFLDAEPDIALRILTSKHGIVQGGLVQVTERMLEREARRGLDLVVAPSVLAYPIVRICESYMYADIIAGWDPDVEEALGILKLLLRGSTR